jgi:hypothetical protein
MVSASLAFKVVRHLGNPPMDRIASLTVPQIEDRTGSGPTDDETIQPEIERQDTKDGELPSSGYRYAA